MKFPVYLLVALASAAAPLESAHCADLRYFRYLRSEIFEGGNDAFVIRESVQKFKFNILPQLNLTQKTAKDAIDELGKLEFECLLVPEERNFVYPEKFNSPLIECRKLLPGDNGIYGILWVFLHVNGWKGDGTSLENRYESMATSRVELVDATGDSHFGKQSMEGLSDTSYQIDQILVFTKPGQSVAEISKYALTHKISCRTAISVSDNHMAIECSAVKVIPRCRYAVISNEVINKNTVSGPLSLWSPDRVIKDKQGKWACLISQ